MNVVGCKQELNSVHALHVRFIFEQRKQNIEAKANTEKKIILR